MTDPSLFPLGGITGVLKLLFRVPKDLPACKTRIMYEGKGIPFFNQRVGVHPQRDGRLTITAIRVDQPKQ